MAAETTDDSIRRCPVCGAVLPCSCPTDVGYGCDWWEDYKSQQDAAND